MNRVTSFFVACFIAVTLCTGYLIWLNPRYVPSPDGIQEQQWALEDMRAHCKCDDMVLVEKRAPVADFLYREENGRVEKIPSPGSWSFVFKLPNGSRFFVDVLPFGYAPVFVGRYSEIIEGDT